MTRYLRVKNWEKYQYDSSKELPWIKFHVDLLAPTKEPWYAELADVSKLLLHHIWLMARVFNGRIPEAWLTKDRLNVASKPNFEPLLNSERIYFEDENGTRFVLDSVQETDSPPTRSRALGARSGLSNSSSLSLPEGECEGEPLVAALGKRGLKLSPAKRRVVLAWPVKYGTTTVLEAFDANSDAILVADHPMQYFTAILRNGKAVPRTVTAEDERNAALDALREWTRPRVLERRGDAWGYADVTRDEFDAWRAWAGTDKAGRVQLTDADGALNTVERWRETLKAVSV